MEQALNACSVLFGTPLYVSQGLLVELSPKDVKIAFRKVVQRHIPGKIDLKKETNRVYLNSLKKIVRARTTLTDFLSSRNRGIPAKRVDIVRQQASSYISTKPTLRSTMPTTSNNSGSHVYYEGNMIPTRLRFGSFLYYSGLISSNMLENALQWQKKRRPLIGQIAMNWGYLSPSDFAEVLFSLKNGDSFGEIALKRNKLNERQIGRIIEKQKIYNCPIGMYFVRNRIFSELQLERYYRDFCFHNSQFEE